MWNTPPAAGMSTFNTNTASAIGQTNPIWQRGQWPGTTEFAPQTGSVAAANGDHRLAGSYGHQHSQSNSGTSTMPGVASAGGGTTGATAPPDSVGAIVTTGTTKTTTTSSGGGAGGVEGPPANTSTPGGAGPATAAAIGAAPAAASATTPAGGALPTAGIGGGQSQMVGTLKLSNVQDFARGGLHNWSSPYRDAENLKEKIESIIQDHKLRGDNSIESKLRGVPVPVGGAGGGASNSQVQAVGAGVDVDATAVGGAAAALPGTTSSCAPGAGGVGGPLEEASDLAAAAPAEKQASGSATSSSSKKESGAEDRKEEQERDDEATASGGAQPKCVEDRLSATRALLAVPGERHDGSSATSATDRKDHQNLPQEQVEDSKSNETRSSGVSVDEEDDEEDDEPLDTYPSRSDSKRTTSSTSKVAGNLASKTASAKKNLHDAAAGADKDGELTKAETTDGDCSTTDNKDSPTEIDEDSCAPLKSLDSTGLGEGTTICSAGCDSLLRSALSLPSNGSQLQSPIEQFAASGGASAAVLTKLVGRSASQDHASSKSKSTTTSSSAAESAAEQAEGQSQSESSSKDGTSAASSSSSSTAAAGAGGAATSEETKQDGTTSTGAAAPSAGATSIVGDESGGAAAASSGGGAAAPASSTSPAGAAAPPPGEAAPTLSNKTPKPDMGKMSKEELQKTIEEALQKSKQQKRFEHSGGMLTTSLAAGGINNAPGFSAGTMGGNNFSSGGLYFGNTTASNANAAALGSGTNGNTSEQGQGQGGQQQTQAAGGSNNKPGYYKVQSSNGIDITVNLGPGQVPPPGYTATSSSAQVSKTNSLSVTHSLAPSEQSLVSEGHLAKIVPTLSSKLNPTAQEWRPPGQQSATAGSAGTNNNMINMNNQMTTAGVAGFQNNTGSFNQHQNSGPQTSGGMQNQFTGNMGMNGQFGPVGGVQQQQANMNSSHQNQFAGSANQQNTNGLGGVGGFQQHNLQMQQNTSQQGMNLNNFGGNNSNSLVGNAGANNNLRPGGAAGAPGGNNMAGPTSNGSNAVGGSTMQLNPNAANFNSFQPQQQQQPSQQMQNLTVNGNQQQFQVNSQTQQQMNGFGAGGGGAGNNFNSRGGNQMNMLVGGMQQGQQQMGSGGNNMARSQSMMNYGPGGGAGSQNMNVGGTISMNTMGTSNQMSHLSGAGAGGGNTGNFVGGMSGGNGQQQMSQQAQMQGGNQLQNAGSSGGSLNLSQQLPHAQSMPLPGTTTSLGGNMQMQHSNMQMPNNNTQMNFGGGSVNVNSQQQTNFGQLQQQLNNLQMQHQGQQMQMQQQRNINLQMQQGQQQGGAPQHHQGAGAGAGGGPSNNTMQHQQGSCNSMSMQMQMQTQSSLQMQQSNQMQNLLQMNQLNMQNITQQRPQLQLGGQTQNPNLNMGQQSTANQMNQNLMAGQTGGAQPPQPHQSSMQLPGTNGQVGAQSQQQPNMNMTQSSAPITQQLQQQLQMTQNPAMPSNLQQNKPATATGTTGPGGVNIPALPVSTSSQNLQNVNKLNLPPSSLALTQQTLSQQLQLQQQQQQQQQAGLQMGGAASACSAQRTVSTPLLGPPATSSGSGALAPPVVVSATTTSTATGPGVVVPPTHAPIVGTTSSTTPITGTPAPGVRAQAQQPQSITTTTPSGQNNQQNGATANPPPLPPNIPRSLPPNFTANVVPEAQNPVAPALPPPLLTPPGVGGGGAAAAIGIVSAAGTGSSSTGVHQKLTGVPAGAVPLVQPQQQLQAASTGGGSCGVEGVAGGVVVGPSTSVQAPTSSMLTVSASAGHLSATPRDEHLDDMSPPPGISPLPAKQKSWSFPADDPSRPSENVYSRAFFIALMPVRSIAPDKRVKESEAAMTWRAKNLTSTENSWMVQQKRQKWDKETEDDVMIVRKIKSSLNKLSDATFDKLSEEILNSGICKPYHIEALMSEVFEKVTTQHHFCDLYTRLCNRLCEHFNAEDSRKLEEWGIHGDKSFRHCLLTQTQNFFEANLQPPPGILEASTKDEEAIERELKYKNKLIGNVKFIGNLLNCGLLARKLLMPIVHQLQTEGTPIALECLATLITIVGSTFDGQQTGMGSSCRGFFDDLFANYLQNQIKEKDGPVPRRVRCLLLDLVDKRKKNWK